MVETLQKNKKTVIFSNDSEEDLENEIENLLEEREKNKIVKSYGIKDYITVFIAFILYIPYLLMYTFKNLKPKLKSD